MELLQSGERGGLVYLTAITSSVTTPIDLSAFVGRYVKITVDQRALISWRSTIDGTEDFSLAAAGASLTALRPDPISPGDQGASRYVTGANPILLVRARSANVTELIVKVTSGKCDA